MESSNAATSSGDVGAATPPASDQKEEQQQQQQTAADERSAEERLKALQEKTAVWKAAVAEQLKEATAKNKSLRGELKALKEAHEQDLVDLRVQLNHEFKERTAMLQEEVAGLNAQVAALRGEKTEVMAKHAADLLAAEERGRNAGHMDSEKDRIAVEEKYRAEVGQLMVALEGKEKEVSQAQHEASLLAARVEKLGEQYAELSSLINIDATSSGAGVEGALAVNDAAHQQQLDTVRAELASKEQQGLRRLERAKAQYEQEREQLVREVQSRDERLAVLQELLRQSQNELSTSQQRISNAQAEAQKLEQHYASKVSWLSQDLATQMEKVEEAQQMNEELQRHLIIAKETITSLEEDAVSREEAFHTLMLSEDDKQLVRNLEAATHAAREEAEDWKLKYYQLQQEQERARRRQRQKRGGEPDELGSQPQPFASGEVREPPVSSSGGGTDDPHDGDGAEDDEEARLLKIKEREEQLAAQAARLEERAQALRAAEIKLDSAKRSIAQQANLILARSEESQAGGGVKGATTSPSASAGQRLSTRQRPSLFFDSLADEPSWARRVLYVLRWAVSTRMRMLLTVSCVMVLSILLASFVTSVKESARSKDVV